MKFEAFVGGNYHDGLASNEDCLNWYPELVESAGGRNRYKFRRTPNSSAMCSLNCLSCTVPG